MTRLHLGRGLFVLAAILVWVVAFSECFSSSFYFNVFSICEEPPPPSSPHLQNHRHFCLDLWKSEYGNLVWSYAKISVKFEI